VASSSPRQKFARLWWHSIFPDTGLTFAQGMGKKEHLAKMLGLSRIAKEWEQRHGVARRHAP